MNTETGQIYDRGQLDALMDDQSSRERRRELERQLANAEAAEAASTRLEEIKALEDGKIVPVSAEVAQKVKLGERELRRRRRRRERDARKRNRK